MEIRKLDPIMIFPDSKATHAHPRWWHELIFWKKYRYPDWLIRAERKTIKEFLAEQKEVKSD